MNTYRFKWIEPKEKLNEQLLLGTTEERVQIAAEKHIRRRLTAREMAIIPGFLTEELEQLIEGEDSMFAKVIREVVELEVRK